MIKEFCDICGEPLSAGDGRYTRYKLKREWNLWFESGWERLTVHNECWEEMCKLIKEKQNEP